MSERPVPEDLRRALRGLSAAYARAADRRDVPGFLAVFAPDAVLEVHRPERPDGPVGVFRGHDALEGIPRSLAAWTSTAHLVGDTGYRWEGGDDAWGEVACEAHHVRADAAGAADEVMTIRYHDRYRRTGDGWRIAHRQVRVASVRTEPADDEPQEAT